MNPETLANLTWLIPAGPLLMFFVIVLFARHNRTLSWVLAWAGVISSLILGWIIAFSMFATYGEDVANKTHELAEHPVQVESSVAWLPFGEFSNWLRMGVAVDPLTAVMLFMVPFAVFMIFVYSVGYHNYGAIRGTELGTPNHGKEEPLFARFFAYMSLFAGAMLLLVVSDNLLLLFVGWEIMGFCSYSLIGFWYARNYKLSPADIPHIPPRQAAIKAFMTTRVADVIMLLGIVFFYRAFGTLNFAEALSAHGIEEAYAHVGGAGLAIMGLLIFTGTVGKSAQWPLHVWLPDAMEGPTPVSATIHAAAMVSAGVYLVIRIFPLLAAGMKASPAVGITIAGIGAFTALMAATIALAQYDVKGVLAYSTISQLGFMIAVLGLGGYVAATFHLITHAFFKALLFLCSGSVIHGMEHGAEHVHDHHTDPQNMMFMGGLKEKMPRTFWTFLIGGFALSGFPLITAGFWSKDEILADAWFIGNEGNPMGFVVFVMLSIAAFLTAFYTMRQLSLTFAGKPRTPLAEHAHESNGFMTWPLIFLSVFAIGAGWVGIPDTFLGTEGVFTNYFHHFVGATVEETLAELKEAKLVAITVKTLPFMIVPLVTSIVVALGGLGLGWLVYWRKPLEAGEPDPLVRPLGPLHTFFNRKWYWDELYHTVFIRPVVYFSEVVVYEWVDQGLINGTLHLIARFFYVIGAGAKRAEEAVFGDGVDWVKDQFLAGIEGVRNLQTGKIQEYALYSGLIGTGLAVLIIFFDNYGWWDQILTWIGL